MAAPMSPGIVDTNTSAIEVVADQPLPSDTEKPAVEQKEKTPAPTVEEGIPDPSQAFNQLEPDEAAAIRLLISAETAPVSIVSMLSFHCNTF